jgi:two-component system, chemotaxis family, chemotaxis protein CheY
VSGGAMADENAGDGTSPAADARRVLLADDSRAGRDLLASMLRQVCVAELLEAGDGHEAMLALRAQPFQLVFLDIEMPGMDGLEVLRQVSALQPAPYVVVVTAHASAVNVKQALELGARGFVVKPYSAQRILDVLRRYLTDTRDTALVRPAR